ncbi:MAG TPA: DNA methyltransferase [Verrucomicrobiales bacterium]|nr:DNA methyltransferase [Verrucomicrobiales bacterium]
MTAKKRTVLDNHPELFVLGDGKDEKSGNHQTSAVGRSLRDELAGFCEFGEKTLVEELKVPGCPAVPVFVNEFWTAGQRQAHSLHEVSYRACFKPQLPRFFIERLTKAGDVVYDPFMGRGTTLIEAALMGRVPWGCDINPLSPILIRPRLSPPEIDDVMERVEQLPLDLDVETWDELLVFYHPEVLRAVSSLRHYFDEAGRDILDGWLRMVTTNRLTGHSAGFLSVYSLPPNQAVSIKSQIRINEKRKQTPPVRDVRKILVKKSNQLLADLTEAERRTLASVFPSARLVTGSCDQTPDLPDNSVSLAVTSPPFLNEVQYDIDNWLRCWFNHIDSKQVALWQIRKPEQWQEKMTGVFRELRRILKPGGHVAFEVGEVRQGSVKLEELVVPAAVNAGLEPELVMINAQEFTKTSNCWGVNNSEAGTNTNRIVLLRKG